LRPARVDVLGDFRGAPATVALVKRYALEAQQDPSVRMLAEDIVQHVGSKDYLSEILSVYNFVLGAVRYCNDPRTIELVKRPGLVARQIAAGQVPSLDCDDLTTLLAALLLSLGREVRAVTVAFHDAFYNGERQYSHIFCEVKEPRSNRWIVLDPVAAEDTDKMLRRVRAVKYWAIA